MKALVITLCLMIMSATAAYGSPGAAVPDSGTLKGGPPKVVYCFCNCSPPGRKLMAFAFGPEKDVPKMIEKVKRAAATFCGCKEPPVAIDKKLFPLLLPTQKDRSLINWRAQ